MQTLLIALLSGLGFIVAYHTYGRWLGRNALYVYTAAPLGDLMVPIAGVIAFSLNPTGGK